MTVGWNYINSVVRMVPTLGITVRGICRPVRNNVDELNLIVFLPKTVSELPYYMLTRF